MNIILRSAVVLCLCVPPGASAAQLAGDDFSKACSGGTKTCHLVSNDKGATWVGPFCGPCSGTSDAGSKPAALQAGEYDGVIMIRSANGNRTFKPGEKLPQLMGGDQVSVGSGLSGSVVFELQGTGLEKVTAGPGAVFRLKYVNASDGWVLESISMQINVETKDGSTVLTPGRVIRLANVRANDTKAADTERIAIGSLATSTELLAYGGPGHATSTEMISYGGVAASSTEPIIRRADSGKAANDREKMVLGAPGDGEEGTRKHNYKGVVTLVRGKLTQSSQTYESGDADEGGAVAGEEGDQKIRRIGSVTLVRGKLTESSQTYKNGDTEPAIFDRWGSAKSGEGSSRTSIDIKDYEAAAKRTLQELADAYSAKRRTAFMHLVSPDFSGDVSTFEEALVKDFHDYRTVNLSLTPDRVLVQGDTASVEFHYNLTVVSDQGVNRTFSGRSNYTFRQEDGMVRLYKMEKPVIFGNSLPSSENPMDAGQNSLAAAESAVPGMQGAVRGSAVVEAPTPSTLGIGFSFETHSATLPADSLTDLFVQSSPPFLYIFPSRGGSIVSIGDCNLESVSSMPGTIGGISATANVGECYALKTGAGKYAVIRVTWVPSIAARGMGFTYKFQPSGSNAF